ncbi:DNA internalization-related competence protein ComEC/Rec2 [Halopseudomonas salegens]|uniref:Competence protein ComEC n=1 Tax=Halopseudomonas salegens TaxID=1434072 RepID=A0A1H2EXS8_9GAMM|nr:DNA internalization-related competence protein ComEC/Rec2 [Halopseudomonas salegens]SDT99932.1 competence protein ComEC [Halopseudomonas salegens]
MHVPSHLLAIIIGLLFPLILSELWSPWWLLLSGLLLALLLRRVRLYRPAFTLVCSLLFGASWALHWHSGQLLQRLPLTLDNQRVIIEARVDGLPEPTAQGWRFQLGDAYLADSGEALPRLRANWFRGEPVAHGEWWRFEASLRRPRGMSNPGSFDYEGWLYAQQIGGLASIRSGEKLGHADPQVFGGWRSALRLRLLDRFSASEQNPRVLALITGDRSVLSREDWQVLQATGTSHLMVISGLHVGILAASVFALFSFLCRCGGLPWPWPRLWLAAPFALCVAALYSALAGFAVPTQRAVLMVALVLGCQLLYRRPGPWALWLAAFCAVLMINPAAPLRAGFWLSFMAVAILLYSFSGRLNPGSWWVRLGLPQWVIFVGLWPWLVLWGMPGSLSAPLVNLFAIPWVGLVIVPMALLGTLVELIAGQDSLLRLAAGCLNGLFHVLEQLAAWQGSRLLAFSDWLSWLSGLAGTLMLLSPLRRLLWPAALACLWGLFFPQQPQPEVGEFWLTVLDVGQGTAVLVQTREHAMLYDAGARFATGFDLGEAVVHPALLALGVRRLDLMLISHADNDHAGGAPAVARLLGVQRVLAGQHEALPEVLDARACQAGEAWDWDGVRLEVVYSAPAPAPANERSCVLRVVAANGSAALLPGDLGIRGEYQMLDRPLQASVLLAPHHGSRSSSSYALIRAVAPEWVVFNAGHHNRFGHPHPLVVERYRELGVEPVYTSRSGAVRFQFGQEVVAEPQWRWRTQARRFWHEP